MNPWYYETTEMGDVVISSRIRLARNLANYNFPERLNDEEAKKLILELIDMAKNIQESEGTQYHSCHVNKLGEIERASMVEWHILSPLLCQKKQDTGLILAKDESVSILLNEEDHIRIQSVTSSNNIAEAYQTADRIDQLLEEHLQYAFHSQYGYLTACPTNVGTGLRASYMLFLPAITICGKLERLAQEVAKYGVTIRGMYGEGSKSLGYLYQISNQKTLGSSEAEIIENLNQLVAQIIQQERMRRFMMLNENPLDLEDKVYRSYAILRYAKKLTLQDAMTLLAQLKFGVDIGVAHLEGLGKPEEPPNLHLLMMEIQPATLQKILGRAVGQEECNRYRAEYMNKRLPNMK